MYEGGRCDSGKVEFLGSFTTLKLRGLAGVCPVRLAMLDSPTHKKNKHGRLKCYDLESPMVAVCTI